jgi:thiol-disulfide isomerase/thioredoxin
VIAMKIICALAVLSLSVAAMPATAEESGQQRAQQAGRAILGAPAPRLTLKTIDGDAIELGALYGKKVVYLKFWATWCVPCRQQMPHFQHVYETAGSDVAVIAIDVGFNDSVEAIRSYRKKLAITMPIVFDDGSLGSAFHLRVTPTHIIIGRDGRIQYVGHLADKQLDDALADARAPAGARAPARTGVPPAGAGAPKAAALTNSDPAPIAVGDLMPKQTVRTLDGQRFEFQRMTAPQKATVLVFLSPWCESYLATTRPEVSENCRKMRTQFSAMAADPRVRWLGIASGLWANSADLREYRRKNQVAIPLTLDSTGELFRAFRVNDVPTVLIADADGRIVRRIDGNAAQDDAALKAAVESL